MAIKTNGAGAIITKVTGEQRRVSCSCCQAETGCCMYPADQLGVGYQEADLPDEVIVQFPSGSPSTWSRSGSYFVSGNLSLRPVDERWALFNNEDEEGDRGVQCLVAPDLLAPRVTDNFADTYTITGFTNQTSAAIVTRISTCEWRGQLTLQLPPPQNIDTFQIDLIYEGFIFDDPNANPPNRLGWSIYGSIKTGNQSSPVGTYEIGDDTVTVS